MSDTTKASEPTNGEPPKFTAAQFHAAVAALIDQALENNVPSAAVITSLETLKLDLYFMLRQRSIQIKQHKESLIHLPKIFRK